MHYGDMTDATNLIRLLQKARPNEIYNLAAQSHVQVSSKRLSTPQTQTPLERFAFSRRSYPWA